MLEENQLHTFSNPRRARIYRLLSLLGYGPAQFFRDACWLMENEHVLLSTSHLVGHLFREVESALRAVVGAIIPEPEDSKGDNHKAQIRAILAGLDMEETHPVAQAWLKFPGKMETQAHRHHLNPPRPVSESRQQWEEFLDILEYVLDQYEKRFFKTYDLLDTILCHEKPSKDDLERLADKCPNNVLSRGYFFEKLESPDWIAPLASNGFFSTPPANELIGEHEGWIRWPESRYLRRMAAKAPEAVKLAFEGMKDTDNPFVHANVIGAALQMPGHLAASLSAITRNWIEKSDDIDLLVAIDLGKLVTHLAKGGEEEALKLAAALLDVLPGPRYVKCATEESCPEDMAFLSLPRPRVRVEAYFEELLRDLVTPLVDFAGLETITLLAQLLAKAITLSSLQSDIRQPQDDSVIWFPAIGRPEHLTSDINQLLALALTDAVIRFVGNDESKLEASIQELEKNNWHIYSRIAMYILANKDCSTRKMIKAYLLNRSLFRLYDVEHEYFLLAAKHFPRLTPVEQERVLTWINEGPVEFELGPTEEDEKRQLALKTWKCRCLHYLREHLVGSGREQYEQLLEEVGTTGQEDLAEERSTKSWIGPTSPLSLQEIEQMPENDLLIFLQEWTEPGGWASPTPEGLGRTLSAAVFQNPTRFASLTPHLRECEPTYLRGVFHGFEQCSRDGKLFSWPPVLELAQWVVDHHAGESDSRVVALNRDPGWGWTRKTIASLVSYGFNDRQGEIPISLRSNVWALLRVLCEDPEPSPQQEREWCQSLNDAATCSLNFTRGQAFHALARYCVWVRGNLEKDAKGSPRNTNWINELPEAREVLERHLDPAVEQSASVRSVYGRWYTDFVWLDPEWASSIARQVFGGPNLRDDLQKEAWNSYVVFCRPFLEVFNILEDVYAIAVSELEEASDKNKDRFQPEPRLANHLITFYAQGAITTERRRRILDDFFTKGSDSLRAEAIYVAGIIAEHASGEGAEEMLSRLHDLWSVRLSTAKKAPSITPFEKELAQFGTLFVSGGFNEAWALRQLNEVLELTGRVDREYEVVRNLAGVSEEHLGEALQCLQLLIKKGQEEWAVMGFTEEAASLLRRCLESKQTSTADQARELIKWLANKGYYHFRHLLTRRE